MKSLNKILQSKLSSSITRQGSASIKKSYKGASLDTGTDINRFNDTSSVNYTTVGGEDRVESTNNLNNSIASKQNLERFENRLKSKVWEAIYHWGNSHSSLFTIQWF